MTIHAIGMAKLTKVPEIAGGLVGILVLYALSVGPVLRISSGTRLDQVVDLFYQPVLELGNTAAWPVLRSYLRLWGVHHPVAEWALAPNLPDAEIVSSYDCALASPKQTDWRPLRKRDGDFILASLKESLPWEPKRTSAFGWLMPPSDDFAFRAVTRDGVEHELTFTRRAESFRNGQMVWDVPGSKGNRIAEITERVLKRQ